MCSNLRLTISEDLLPLSVQNQSPDLFAFIVLSLNFLTLLVNYVTTNNKFHRSIMTHWRRRQTRRQTIPPSRVIDSSSVRVEQRLTDNGVVVVQAFGEPLLGYGLLIELDTSLCEEVVSWAHNLWRRTCSPGDPTPQRQCAWLLSTYLKENKREEKKCWKLKMMKRKEMK